MIGFTFAIMINDEIMGDAIQEPRDILYIFAGRHVIPGLGESL